MPPTPAGGSPTILADLLPSPDRSWPILASVGQHRPGCGQHRHKSLVQRTSGKLADAWLNSASTGQVVPQLVPKPHIR